MKVSIRALRPSQSPLGQLDDAQLAGASAPAPSQHRERSNKFRNKPVEIDGIRFASKREANRYSILKMLEKRGLIAGLALQPRFPLRVNGKLICTYVADFLYEEKGETVVEDAKGFRTPEYKIKAKLFEAIYGFPVREV